MRTCKEIMQLASDGLDRKLPLSQRISLGVHLVLCRGCRDAAKMVQTIHRKAEECTGCGEKLAESETLSEESRMRIILELERNRDE